MAVGSVYITCGFQGRGEGALYLHFVRIGEGVIQNFDDGSKSQPAWHLNNERSLISGEQRPILWRTGKERYNWGAANIRT